jgi:hypothetical protein
VESGRDLTKTISQQHERGLPILVFTHHPVDHSIKTEGDLSTAVKNMALGEKDGRNEGLPVWVYGNYWAEYDSEYPGDVSRSKEVLMGVGARFGTTSSILDVANARPGQISIRGSTIRISTDDGKSPNHSNTVQLVCVSR